MQVRAAFLAGRKFSKYLNSGISGEDAWIAKALGWFMGTILGLAMRLEFGLLMVPLQALVALFQHNQSQSERAIRGTVLGVFLVTFGVGVYEIRQASAPRFTTAPQFPQSQPAPPLPLRNQNPAPAVYAPPARPSLNCAKVTTPNEQLICRDSRLAALDVEMAEAFRQALARSAQNRRVSLRQSHLAWFKECSRTCNQAGTDAERAVCITDYLSAHTVQLKSQ